MATWLIVSSCIITLLFLVMMGYSNISFHCLYSHIMIKFYLLYWIILFNWMMLLSMTNMWGNSSVLMMWMILFMMNWINMYLFMMVMMVSSYIVYFSINYLMIVEMVLFIVYMMLFKYFMSLLLDCYDLIVLFLLWELLGLMSYLLINYHSNKVNSGMKAVMLNSIGDILMIYVLVIANWSKVGINNEIQMYYSLFMMVYCIIILVNLVNLIQTMLFSFIIMITKSAQFPFVSWLLGAMNAPIPVSALLHSSTLVIIGLIYFISFSTLISLTSFMWITSNCISLMWSVFKVICIIDIKTIIALSTINQLSFMFLMIIMSIIMALFHLIIHSLFKSNLFLNSDSIINNSGNYQSLSKIKSSNLSINCNNLISLSLLILSISKEFIIFYIHNILLYIMFTIMMMFGSFFSFIYSWMFYLSIIV